MITADRFSIDGDTAWLVFTDEPPFQLRCVEFWQDYDRPCDTCDGHPPEWDHYGKCPDCIAGRHTFDLIVEADHPLIHLPGARIIHRVSIVPGMVLPIEADSTDPLYPRVVMRDDRKQVLVMPGYQRHDIPSRFPSAAAPGMWAVKLRVIT